MPSPVDLEPIPSVKDLASSDPSLRRKSLTKILTYLSADTQPPKQALTPTHAQQLWRGFSVCLYMHDSKSAVSVQNLISTLASTFQTLYDQDVAQNRTDDENAEAPKIAFDRLRTWHEAFWLTLCREWPTLDQWRMNKYLLLIRLVIRQIFTILMAEGDSKSTDVLWDSQTEVFREWPLSPRERKVPDGLRLHVLDVWVDEWRRVRDEQSQNKSNSGGGKRKRKWEDDGGEGDEDESEAEAEDQDEDGEGEDQDRKDDPNSEAQDQITTHNPNPKLITNNLLQALHDLSKESISKSVKTKAKEVVKDLEQESQPGA